MPALGKHGGKRGLVTDPGLLKGGRTDQSRGEVGGKRGGVLDNDGGLERLKPAVSDEDISADGSGLDVVSPLLEVHVDDDGLSVSVRSNTGDVAVSGRKGAPHIHKVVVELVKLEEEEVGVVEVDELIRLPEAVDPEGLDDVEDLRGIIPRERRGAK